MVKTITAGVMMNEKQALVMFSSPKDEVDMSNCFCRRANNSANGAMTISNTFGSNQDHSTLRNWSKHRKRPITDLFSALVEWNIVLRQAGWIIPALIQVIFYRGTITRARVIEIFLLYNIGVGGMITATSIIFHTLFADQTAESIGWLLATLFKWR